MGLFHVGLLLLLGGSCASFSFPKSLSGYGPFVQNPDLEWERMETVIGEELTRTPAHRAASMRSASSAPQANKVPEYRIISKSEDPVDLFMPEKGARPLPQAAKDILSVTSPPDTATGKSSQKKLVEILCHVDRMYVRIRREVFTTADAYKYLKLGSCPVNQGTKAHYYLLYLLKDCGFKKEYDTDFILISNKLQYNPTTKVVREMPFDIPLQCKFPRFFHSYKVGFLPKMEGGSVFKALQPKSSYTLTPQDASGNELTGSKTYTLGQPMYFEAKAPPNTESSDKRMYVNKCFMTASRDPNSEPKYTVIDNQGCMIDGKVTAQSKFLPCASKTIQKFSVSAFIFKDMVSLSSSSQQLYMHCEMSLKKMMPTPSSKACNYDPSTKKWKELYGDDSVCACCESSCSSARSRASQNVVSSHAWKVNFRPEDDYMEFLPKMKSFNAESLNMEDPDMAEHRDFLNYWENDY